MPTQKLHFEVIPVSTVKKILEDLPQEEADRLPQEKKENGTESGNGWRELAQRAQRETDANKMLELVEQLIEKFNEEKLQKNRAAQVRAARS